MFETLFANETAGIAAGLLIPFIGNTIGAATVLFTSKKSSDLSQKLMLGFAAGVMLSAIIWSLLIPSMEMAEEQGESRWLAPVAGFLAGMLFLLVIDTLTPHLHVSSDSVEGLPSRLQKSTMLILAIVIHHIPEGMAMGVVFAGVSVGGEGAVTAASAIALSFGMALQNIPEGAVVSLPLKNMGQGKLSSFLYGAATGLVQPVSAIAAILLIGKFPEHIFPALLAFAAGAMMYVIVEEIIPESQNGKHTNIATIGLAAGFALMMIMDSAL